MSEQTTTDERIVEALRHRDAIVLTASDLAEEIGAHRTTVLDHLRDLEAAGEVESIDVGAKAVGWYLPGDEIRVRDEPFLIPTYEDYIRRPVDQRGRVTIGAEYAHKTMTFAILDPPAVMEAAPGEWNYQTPLKWQRTAAVMDDEADDRGRVSLNRDWAGRTVSIAVLEVEE